MSLVLFTPDSLHHSGEFPIMLQHLHGEKADAPTQGCNHAVAAVQTQGRWTRQMIQVQCTEVQGCIDSVVGFPTLQPEPRNIGLHLIIFVH